LTSLWVVRSRTLGLSVFSVVLCLLCSLIKGFYIGHRARSR
jgi:uncharacterized protein YneF (UPF0154 family)